MGFHDGCQHVECFRIRSDGVESATLRAILRGCSQKLFPAERLVSFGIDVAGPQSTDSARCLNAKASQGEEAPGLIEGAGSDKIVNGG